MDAYFATKGLPTDGGWRLRFKSLVILAWLAASYAACLLWATTWWQAAICAISIGFAMAGVGFNIQHDGGHDAYAKGRAGNRIAAWALDLVGGSSYVWRFKHAIVHHSYTNIEGADDDIDAAPFMRLSPGQTRRWYHRFQHVYAWLLFGFLSPKWAFWDDYAALARGHIGPQPLPRPSFGEAVVLVLGKLVFYGWTLILPIMIGKSVGAVLAVYGIAAITTGITTAVVFQLAHCIKEADFVATDNDGRIASPWCEHQLATTVDFAPKSRFLTWYLGGLNFQVEHHLFPRVSHIHYPAIAPLVSEVCREHGVTRRVHERFFPALASHVRHLRLLGQRTSLAPATA